MDVTYSIKCVLVLYMGKEIIRGNFDKRSQLWFFDIQKLLEIPDIPNLIDNKDNSPFRINRLKAQEIITICETHKKFAHLAPNTLASVIDSEVLDDVPASLTGSAIRTLNKVDQCVVCEAARRKQVPNKEGSGSTSGVIGAG